MVPRSLFAAFTAVCLLAGSAFAADAAKKDQKAAKPAQATITKVDANKGEITVRYPGHDGKPQEKTFQLTKDIQLLDETGRAVNLAVFQAGDQALLVQSEGKVRELRRAPHLEGAMHLSDSVRSMIEMAACDPSQMSELQAMYAMLRKLDTGKSGKIDPQAVKAEGEAILQHRVDAVFTRLDTNKDGKISKDEAHGLIKEHFDKIDTNKDGFIERDELLKAAKEHCEAKAAGGRSNTTTKPVEKERK